MTVDEQLASYLTDAHAIEQQAIQLLKKAPHREASLGQAGITA